jgi:multidrug efflux pump subunit AcrB
MIVDDAIVVAENIFRCKETTPDMVGASIEGAAGIAGPDASGTFTTVAAFLPFVLITGMAAVFLRPFALTIASALVVSLVLSLTLVPILFSRTKGALDARREHLGGKALALIRRRLRRFLNFSLRRRRWVIIISIAALGLSGLTLFWTKASFLPPIDEGALLVEYIMPPGTSLRESNRMGEIIEGVAMHDPDVSTVYRRTGSPEVGHEIEGVNMGELLIKLRPRAARRRDAAEIMNSLKRAYSAMQGMVFLFHQPTQEKIDESFSGLPALFGLTVYGPDMDKLRVIAGEAEKVLEKDPSIGNVINNTKIRTPEVRVRLDYAALARHGFNPSDVFASLRAARFGVEATRIIRQREDARVIVRLASGEVLTPDDIRRLPVGGSAAIPLERVADVSIGRSPATITRINGQREVTLIAEVEGNIPGLVKRLKRGMRGIQLPPGYSIEFAGEYRVLMKTALEMAFILAAALVLIYLIMVMQFHALIQPLIILATIPISFIGALFAVFITGQGIDVSVAMGAVTLAGIAVNNAIVLMDFFNNELRAGKDVPMAIASAVSVRLRPILLTSFTTIAALLPAAIGMTTGSRIFQPFAITVIGGLISSVAATLIVVPTLTSMLSSTVKGSPR